jgi:DNA repair exonuclease SbcCD ATPase subunit
MAAMAIRLAMVAVTNLPRGSVFVLDEPATSLDEEHMEGFVRMLEVVKTQFHTILLISHLDSLKDCVDMTIEISKIDGFAKVKM